MALVSHGYPDFNRVVSQSDVLFLSQTDVTINGTTEFTLGFVGNLPYIGFRLESIAGAARMAINFFTDATYTSSLGSYAVDVKDGGVFGATVPLGGPFCKVTLLLGGVSFRYLLKIWSAPAESSIDALSPLDNVLLSASGQAIGAGANQTFQATRTFPASAVLCVSTTAVSWVGHLFVTDYLGNITHIHFFTPGVTQYNQLVYLPAMPASLNLKNNDAGTKLFDFSLIARPWSPGR